MDWTRKNPFIRALRSQLKRFRVVAIQFDMAEEMKPNVTTDEPLREWGHTGRTVVTIKIFGYWREKPVPVLPPT